MKPRVRARDTFGKNESVLDLGAVEMTRLRWVYPAGTPATGSRPLKTPMDHVLVRSVVFPTHERIC